MWRLWMMYMTPSRRAMAKRRPLGSAPNSQLKTWWEATCSLWSLTATPQSQARPSLCSLVPPIEQSREMPQLAVAG